MTLWVVSTIDFHFVLFGVIAQRTGLGQLFIDNATILAGRYTGGPAKVSVVSSAFFGMISGSSVANTVSTGALTIPKIKRLGYLGPFAGGVEAASSAGGQITPSIMGAAAFIMAEFLELPYTTIVIAAIFPALLHYAGVFTVVHLMARKLDLKGLTKEQLPKLKAVWSEGWANIVPLVGLLVVLFSGYTPFMSAFCGISLAVFTGMSRLKEPPTLVYSAAFISFVLWKFIGGGFDLTMTIILCAGILCAGSAMDDTVTILGAGIVGICSALSLQDRGVRVRLIDRGAPGQETSYGNAGIISPWSIVAQASAGHRP